MTSHQLPAITELQRSILRAIGERRQLTTAELHDRLGDGIDSAALYGSIWRLLRDALLAEVQVGGTKMYRSTAAGLAQLRALDPIRRRAQLESREHGTVKGYGQHRRIGDSPCQPCREAASADAGPRARARSAALTRLAQRYPLEYQRLLNQEKTKRGI